MTPRLDCMRGNGRLDVLTILERALAELSSLLFELLDGTLVDTTALVDKVTSSRGLAGIDVTDNCAESGRTGGGEQHQYSPTTLTWVFSFPIFDEDLQRRSASATIEQRVVHRSRRYAAG